MALHRIEHDAANMRGFFSRDLPPILTIEPGDSVEYQIPDAAWNIRPRRFAGDSPIKMGRPDPEMDTGHCLAGPIFIRGAKPGDTLEIKVEELRVGSHGWTSSGGWPHEVHKRLDLVDKPESDLFWELDAKALTAKNQYGHQIRLAPFLGVMGMPSDIDGVQPTPPPRRTGGNLDCKEIQVGTSLFLPIQLEGGLFSCGDGHAQQGDGEVCVTAIECPMEHAVLSFQLHKDFPISTPRVRTTDSWVTLGMDEDLDEAVMMAIEEMIDYIGEKYKVDKSTALGLASVLADVRVTQIVNGVKGAHVIWRDDAIK